MEHFRAVADLGAGAAELCLKLPNQGTGQRRGRCVGTPWKPTAANGNTFRWPKMLTPLLLISTG